jgi:hypothetical protein
MNNGLFTLTWSNVKSALIYGLLAVVVTFLLVVCQMILDAGSIYGLDWLAILDKGALAVIGVFVSFLSIVKNLLTTADGKFLGFLEVIPDKTKAKKK